MATHFQVVDANATKTITLTENAIKKAKELLEKEPYKDKTYLRVGVLPGGCSGFKRFLEFDTEVNANDEVLEFDDVRVVIDSDSAKILKGTVIDYKDGLGDSGFKLDNPSTTHTCGCGQSFS